MDVSELDWSSREMLAALHGACRSRPWWAGPYRDVQAELSGVARRIMDHLSLAEGARAARVCTFFDAASADDPRWRHLFRAGDPAAAAPLAARRAVVRAFGQPGPQARRALQAALGTPPAGGLPALLACPRLRAAYAADAGRPEVPWPPPPPLPPRRAPRHFGRFRALPTSLQEAVLARVGLTTVARLACAGRGMAALAASDPRWSGVVGGGSVAAARARLCAELMALDAPLRDVLRSRWIDRPPLGTLAEELASESMLRNVLFCEHACGPLPPAGEAPSRLREMLADFPGSGAQRLGIEDSQLTRLPPALGLPAFAGLTQLELSRCRALAALPEAGLAVLGGLVSLEIFACPALATLPQSLGALTRLRLLTVVECEQFTHLPATLGHLTQLVTLEVDGCWRLRSLPASLGALGALETLEVGGTSSLRSLPDDIGRLSRLTTLALSDCLNLRALPRTLGGLMALERLHLDRCEALASLPRSIGRCSALAELVAARCGRLTALPRTVGLCTALVALELDGCAALRTLPASVSCLERLQTLDLGECPSLSQMPPSFARLTALTFLSVAGCAALRALPADIADVTAVVAFGCPAVNAA